jgi:hypothetical protein
LFLAGLFLVGTPAGFSFYGMSWTFPWLTEVIKNTRDVPNASVPARPPQELVARKPVVPKATVSVQRVWAGQASVIYAITVRNDDDRSLELRSGHVNLSELGIASADWPAVVLPAWDVGRYQLAKVQISADRELPGAPHSFPLALSVPAGRERKFLLQLDATNLPLWQQNRFFAVGTLVLKGDDVELATADSNFFGLRLMQPTGVPANLPVRGTEPQPAPVLARAVPQAPPHPPAAPPHPSAAPPRANESRWPSPTASVQKLFHQLGKMTGVGSAE